jgi:hypothetical protein
MPNSVYTIATVWRSIEDQLIESGGELTDEIAAEIEAAESATDEAVTALICLTKEREATNNFIKQEVALLGQRKKNNEKVIETYERTLTEVVNRWGVMHSNGYKKYEVGAHRVTFRESKSTEVNEELIKFIIDYAKREFNRQYKTYAGGEWVEFPDTKTVAEDMTKEVMRLNSDLLVEGYSKVLNPFNGEIENKPYYSNITTDDIESLRVKVSIELPLADLMKATENDEAFDLLQAWNYYDGSIEPIYSKTELKQRMDNAILAIAKSKTNANIQIK